MARRFCRGFISALLALLVLCQIYRTEALCTDKWTHFQGFCFHVPSQTGTWFNARKRCLKLGAELASLDSEADNAHVVSIASKANCTRNRTWIGLHLDSQNTSRWIWSDSEVVKYRKWHPMAKQTIYEQNKSCTELRPSVSAFWYKNVCSQNNCYVCKRDADECTSRDICDGHACINTHGSYRCECKKGFLEEHRGQICSDIDECSRANGGCPHTCINTHGSFVCQCQDGYVSNKNDAECNHVMTDASNNKTNQHVPVATIATRRDPIPDPEDKVAKKDQEESKSTDLGMLVAMGIPLCCILCFLVLCYMKGPGKRNQQSGDESDSSNQEALVTGKNVSRQMSFSEPLQEMV